MMTVMTPELMVGGRVVEALMDMIKLTQLGKPIPAKTLERAQAAVEEWSQFYGNDSPPDPL
jgi:hypothetical protein